MNKLILIIATVTCVSNIYSQSTSDNNIGSSTKFLGFSNNFGLRIATNNLTRMWFNPEGTVLNGGNTSGFIGIGTNNPFSPLHIIGRTDLNNQGWRRGLTISNSGSIVFDGGSGRSMFMAFPSFTPNSNFYAGSQTNLNSTSPDDYAYSIATNTPIGPNPLNSIQFFKNVLISNSAVAPTAVTERKLGLNTLTPQNVMEINTRFLNSGILNGAPTASGYTAPSGLSGLRFSDLSSASIPQLNPSGIALSK